MTPWGGGYHIGEQIVARTIWFRMTELRPSRVDFETLVVFAPSGSEDAFTGTSVNLSLSGMLVRSERRVEPGSVLQFATAAFAGECEVMWGHESSDGGSLFGIRFVSLGPRADEELAKILYESADRK